MKHFNFILLIVVLTGMAYELVPKGLPLVQPFWTVSDEQYLRFHIYLNFEHLKLIGSAIAFYFFPSKSIVAKVYLAWLIGDIIDYNLTNNNVYFKAGFVPISYNTISALVFGIVCYFDEKTNYGKR